MPDRYIVTLHFKPIGEESIEWKERRDIQVARNLRSYERIRVRGRKKMMKQRRIYERIHAMTVERQEALLRDIRELSVGRKLALLEEATSGHLVISRKQRRALRQAEEDECPYG